MAGSCTLASVKVWMPRCSSTSAAAAANTPENFASSPVRGRSWMRMFGTEACTPTVTSRMSSGRSRCRWRSSRAPSMMEWVHAHEG